MPNNLYSEQKPIRLVTRKMTARIPRIMAQVPEITPVKYSTAMAAAII